MMKSETISLPDFSNSQPVKYLWICGVGCPTGLEFNHNVESDGEDYCDVSELLEEFGFLDLVGTIDASGRWNWNGEGSPVDIRGNSIQRIVAG